MMAGHGRSLGKSLLALDFDWDGVGVDSACSFHLVSGECAGDGAGAGAGRARRDHVGDGDDAHGS